MKASRKSRRWALWAMAAIFICSGCAAMYVNPGPNPVSLTVKAKVHMSEARKQAGLDDRLGAVMASAMRLGYTSEPTWFLRALLPQENGTLLSMPLANGQDIPMVEGANLELNQEFLAPPGTYETTFLLECFVRVAPDIYTGIPEYILVGTWEHKETLTFEQGSGLTMTPFAGDFK